MEKLFNEIREGRDAGFIYLAWAPFQEILSLEDYGSGAGSRANHYLLSLGLLPNAHHEVDRENALLIATHVLQRDLAYSEELVPEAVARDRAERFLQACENGLVARYFTNGFTAPHRLKVFNIEGQQLSGWSAVTQSTFDNGILVSTPTGCGVLWVEDED